MVCGKNGREKVTVAEVAVGSLNSFFVIYSIYNDAKRLKLEKAATIFKFRCIPIIRQILLWIDFPQKIHFIVFLVYKEYYGF